MSIQLSVLGIPLRIQPWFFVTVYLIGGLGRPPELAAVWVVAAFLAVLLHELGHAGACIALGYSPEIELYAMGGVTSWRRSGSETPLRHLLISAAGPVTGIIIGSICLAFLAKGSLAPDGLAANALKDLVFTNLGWGILNLVPVLPLDGGNIATSIAVMVLGARGRVLARGLSLAVTIALAGLFLFLRELWLAFLCAFLAAVNWRALQTERLSRSGPGLVRGHEGGGTLASLEAAATDGRWDELASLATSLHDRAKDNAQRAYALRMLVRARLELGDVVAARTAFNAMPEGAPSDPALLGSLLHDEGQAFAALPHLNAALKQRPSPLAEARWMESVIRTGRFSQAADLIESAAGAHINPRTVARLDEAAYEAGAFEDAARFQIALFRRASRPTDAYNAACSLARAGRLDEAVRWLETSVEAGLDDPTQIDRDADLDAIRSRTDFARIRERL